MRELSGPVLMALCLIAFAVATFWPRWQASINIDVYGRPFDLPTEIPCPHCAEAADLRMPFREPHFWECRNGHVFSGATR